MPPKSGLCDVSSSLLVLQPLLLSACSCLSGTCKLAMQEPVTFPQAETYCHSNLTFYVWLRTLVGHSLSLCSSDTANYVLLRMSSRIINTISGHTWLRQFCAHYARMLQSTVYARNCGGIMYASLAGFQALLPVIKHEGGREERPVMECR